MISLQLIELLLEKIHDENLARYRANANPQYDHSVYDAHERRIYRLVAALCDGDTELERRYNEALFDITHDGLNHYRRVFAQMLHERTEERAEAGVSCP